MKSFFLPIGHMAGASLSTVVSALSCGAAVPVTGLDILYLSDDEPDPVLPLLISDLNRVHTLLSSVDHPFLFPSSFRYDACRLRLPSVRELSADPSSEAFLNAVRGKGIPLSYRTDREAVDWAVSVLLSKSFSEALQPFEAWTGRVEDAALQGAGVRVALLCDLCDPFSAGTAFAILRWLKNTLHLRSCDLSLFCLTGDVTSEQNAANLSESLYALDHQGLVGTPDNTGDPCADAAWLLSLPSSMIASEDSYRLLYAIAGRQTAAFFAGESTPSPGLHTVHVPGILTFASLDDQALPFSVFLHAAVWLLSDLLPALDLYLLHPGALRSLAPNTRNGLFKRLFHQRKDDLRETVSLLTRALSAVLSEILSLIRFLPDQLRLSEFSDPLWRETVDACGRAVTVASEYDVSVMETEEAGIMDVRPVHRVSLADTEEEKQQHRLESIASQLESEIAARNAKFASVGGSRAYTALLDCHFRCLDALDRARESLKQLTADPNTGHLAIAAQERRIRLLNAAVARCEQDLSDRELLAGLSRSASPAGSLSPFDNQLLSAKAASVLASLISAAPEAAEPLRKELRALLPDLFFDQHLSDEKGLLRRLLSVCLADEQRDPLSTLLESVSEVSREELSSVRFLSAGNVPPILLLPDLYPIHPPVTIAALLPLLPDHPDDQARGDAALRGLTALLLLRQYRRRTSEEAALYCDHYTAEDSALLRVYLTTQQAPEVRIFSLGTEEVRLPFALIMPGRMPVQVRLSPAHAALIPSFAMPWFDEESLSFRDPCGLLSEGDRAVLGELLEKLTDTENGVCSEPLKSFLLSFRHDLLREETPAALPEQLELRLKAAFGLRLLPAFQQSLLRQTCYYEHFLASDDVASALLGKDTFIPSACNVPDDIIYLYRDVPFARENSLSLLDTIPLPSENWIMNLLDQESETLFRASDDYHDALVRELSLLLERYPDAAPEARQVAMDLLEKASEPVTDTETELTWPWDLKSPSVLTILTESLGEELAPLAIQPFSDILALCPARGSEIIGDTLLATMCVLPPVTPETQQEEDAPVFQPDAVLPPLSESFCAALCRTPEGRTLFNPDFLSFERCENSAIRVSLNLSGSFPVHLIREYGPEEIINLYAHDIPTLAVWPNLPMAQEDWHAYFVYSHLPDGCHISIFNSAQETLTPDAEDSRCVCRTASFPLSFSFYRAELCIGSLPNILPSPELQKTEQVTACVDFGSVGTSVAFAVGHQRRPLQGGTLVRTLLNNPASSRDLLRREFLPAVPVTTLLPTATRIFRNVPGSAPLPFEDGIVLMSSNLQDVLSIPSGALYTCLKWEEEKGRSVSLCLHQIMLMAALQARVDGAVSLSWRFAIPDEMASAGRERLLDLFTSLAGKVNEAAGFASAGQEAAVSFAPESSALGAYFRLCAPEDTRGGFMVLDIGACTADISLFLRGREQAIRTCQIPLGVHYMLLPFLLRNPAVLTADLGHIQDPLLMQETALLRKTFENARADSSALRHSRLALDNFLADRYLSLLPDLLQNPLTGMPTYTGSVLLFSFSYLMMLSGLILLQIAADPGKNDFLPEQMSLCLAGRGSILLESLPVPYRTALWHFLTMFRNRRVASLSMLFSAEKKIEIPVGLSVLQDVSTGLPAASAVPAAISVRPEELLPRFLLQFAKEFPASAELLFHGFYTGDFYHPFTPYGESLIAEAISQSFTEQTVLRPFDALSAWVGSQFELLAENPSPV